MVEFVSASIGLAFVFGVWLFLFFVVCALLPYAYDQIKEFHKKLRGQNERL